MFSLAILLVYPPQLVKVSRGLGDFEYKADGLSLRAAVPIHSSGGFPKSGYLKVDGLPPKWLV